MGAVVTDQEKKKETLEEARNRFLLNYYNLAVQPDMEWFNHHVPTLLKIAGQPLEDNPPRHRKRRELAHV